MSESNQEYIVISGARENNLKNVSLRIPKRKITIFTGVSGSGKSSIVFDTIAAESTRLLNENFSMFVRNFLPRVPQPDTDAIENLSMAVIVDQKRLGGGSHSTLGTITDISPILRLLFSRVGQPYVGQAHMFSFNDLQGMCPECNGLGRRLGVDMSMALDKSKSLHEGAIMLPDYSVNGWEWNMIVQSGDFDLDKKLSDYSEEELEQLLYAKARKVKMDFAGKATNITVEGVIEKFTNKYIKQDVKMKSERTQKAVAPYISEGPCSSCHGARLSQATLSCRINGLNIAELSSIEAGQLIRVIREINDPVAGSGKSTMINEVFLSQHPDAIVIDQSAIGVSTRSNPATYTGIMDDVRKAFASANKVSQGLFSFNSKGACENCQGLGVVYTDLAFLDSVKLPCEVCGGRRFKEEVLAYKLNGKSIAEVLEMNVEQALAFFQLKEVVRKLQAMSDVGLNYITLGQPLSTLSGGECQRIKLASELHKKGSIYVMDEPTTGLHMSDIGHLLEIINRLVDTGNTVIVIEHNLDVISQADWIIDMGPDGGSKGGQVVFEGTPPQIIHAEQSITGRYLM
ncbi:ATP-binding cassette domain-containing protein [Paenibacillus sp. sgz500992]|uniref:ATP-binding cassette domain-containing protein n=1 Tax=Paenibacillus sp. sgz500992 TaxID=3242476 RepID=UPI0036D277CA